MPVASAAASCAFRRSSQGSATARVTPSGRQGYVRRWTAEAAIFANEAIVQIATISRASKKKIISDALLSAEAAGRILARMGAVVSTRVTDVARAILHDYSCKAHGAQGSRVDALVQQLRSGLRTHAGPPGRLPRQERSPPLGPAALDWLDDGPCPMGARAPPPEDGRVATFVASLDLQRLGPLPPTAVICPERAAARVAQWAGRRSSRSGVAPPICLLRAIVHTAYLPTAVASSGDHFWLVVPGRWASPSETLRLFGVQESSDLWAAAVLRPPLITPRQMVSCAGRGIHAGDAARVMRHIHTRTTLPTHVRYASSCSGWDMFATCLDSEIGAGRSWSYVHASESRPALRAFLQRAYSARGLTHVACDARCRADSAPPSDLWVISPPCETFSRRNHCATDADVETSSRDLLRMMHYPATHRPLVVVIENVGERDARSVITAAALSLRGYDWVALECEARDHGPMARARVFWVGIRT